ncbi:MAG: hypothetical protein RLZZ15_28 [Verrucomicrobiota bacterium]|jgi:hypothetical protein
MKTPLVLLAASLAGNALLAGLFVSRPGLLPPVVRDVFTSSTDRAATDAAEAADATHARRSRAAAKSAADAKAAAAARTGVWAALKTDDLPTLVARLRAAGFSAAVVRAVVNAQLEARFSARMNELLGTLGDTPFWKPEPFSSMNNPKFYESYTQLYRDRSKALRELLGDDFFAAGGADPTTAQRAQFGDLPKAKIALVQRIVDDYAEMLSQVRAATQGVTLPEDREKFALLEREKRADLAAILSPSELEAYEMRTSTITSRLRTGLTLMDATAAEFAAIFRAQQPFDELLNPTGGRSYTRDIQTRRTEAETQIAAQLKATLGDARYADYARATDYEYQQLARLAQNQGVGPDALVRAYDVRAAISAESMRIENARLGYAERAAALRALAEKARNQIAANVGLNVADAYAASATWLTAVQRGFTFQRNADGVWSFYPGPTAPK